MGTANQFLNDRQSLYRLVWAKPADVLAADLRVSEQVLIARCIESQIPRPLAGYWRALLGCSRAELPFKNAHLRMCSGATHPRQMIYTASKPAQL